MKKTKTQNLKNNSSAEPRSHFRPLQKKVGIIILVVTCVLISVWAWRWITIQNDKARFIDFSKKKSVVINELTTWLGDRVVSAQEKDECFRTEQGPYDNGKLWCQTGSIITLNAGFGVAYSDIAKEFSAIAERNGYTVGSGNSIEQRHWFEAAKGIVCMLEFKGPENTSTGGVARSLLFDKDPPAIAIACADRAKAAHYPVVE